MAFIRLCLSFCGVVNRLSFIRVFERIHVARHLHFLRAWHCCVRAGYLPKNAFQQQSKYQYKSSINFQSLEAVLGSVVWKQIKRKLQQKHTNEQSIDARQFIIEFEVVIDLGESMTKQTASTQNSSEFMGLT